MTAIIETENKYKPYHVQGWIQVTIDVNSIIYAESPDQAKQRIHADIESGDFSGDYNIYENNCEFTATLTEDE